MAASFPTSVKSFSTRSAGDTIQPAHINDLQDEVAAIETALRSSTSYTPTYSGAIGNGSLTGQYAKLGEMVWFRVSFTAGSTTTFTSPMTFSLPVTSAISSFVAGTALLVDNGTGTVGGIAWAGTTTVTAYPTTTPPTPGQIDSTNPFTWTTNDQIHISGWYPAA